MSAATPSRGRRWLLLLPVCAAIGWIAGFAWFVQIAWRPPTPPPHADGIVVLTGGAERVEVGLRLLRDNAADRLLISGVGRAAEFPELAHRAGIDAHLGPRVTLGHHAVSTHGNATETADWAQTHRVTSLIVVTAGYHMPRAMAELHDAMPDVVLYPVPVQPPGMRSVRDPMTWRLLAGEYTKFLAVRLGLAHLGVDLGLPGFGAAGERNG